MGFVREFVLIYYFLVVSFALICSKNDSEMPIMIHEKQRSKENATVPSKGEALAEG